jgi:hypothetical protein
MSQVMQPRIALRSRIHTSPVSSGPDERRVAASIAGR